MDKASSTLGLARTKSEQLAESMAALKLPPKAELTAALAESSSSANVSRRSSRRTMSAASPGRGGAGRSNSHIRKSSSAQLSWQVDDQLTSGAALSRASSASLGLSFSLTGYIMPPEDIADSTPFSDDEIPEDLEAGTKRKRIEAEPTLPIYLKAGTTTTSLSLVSGVPSN